MTVWERRSKSDRFNRNKHHRLGWDTAQPSYRHSRERGLCFTSAEPNIQGFTEA